MAVASDLAMAFTAPLSSRRRVRLAVQSTLGLLFILTLIFYHDRIVQSTISVLPAGLVGDPHDAGTTSDPPKDDPPPPEKPKPSTMTISLPNSLHDLTFSQQHP